MNLAVRRFILFFFSIATLSACEDPTDIGIDLQEDNKIGTNYTDTLTVNSGTVLLSDSVLSFRTVPALVGSVNDPALGNVKASYFTEVNLNGSNVKFGENPVADSLVLTLDYRLLYGATDNPVTIKVYELAEGFQEKESYFTNSELALSSNLLGSTTVVPRISARDIDGAGTAANVDSATLIRIQLDPSLTQRIINESDRDALKTQQNFNAFFKGIALVVEGDPNAQLLGISVASNTVIKSNQTALTLYYKNGADSKNHRFLLNGTNIKSFSNIVSDRSGSAVASLMESGQFVSSDQINGLSYVQAGTQLFTKLTFPHLQKLREQQGDIIINRAELIVPVQQGSNQLFTIPKQLVMYETNNTNRILRDSNGNPRAVQMSSSSSINSNLFPTALTYNADKSQYSVNITSYVQSLLLDAKPNNGLLLAPANLAAGENGTAQIVPEIFPLRAILSNTEANSIKLRIYFSQLN